jgi:hypothetical protein
MPYGIRPDLGIEGCMRLPQAYRSLPRGYGQPSQAIH